MSQISRNRVPGLPQDEALLRLNAPGLDVPPPDMSGANSFAALENLIHAGISGVSAVAQVAQDQRLLNQHAKKIDEGLGAQHAAMILPDILGKIDRGEITLAPGETPADRASSILAAETQGQNDAFKLGVQNRAAPHVLTALETQLTQRQARDTQDAFSAYASRAANGDLAGSLADAAQKFPNTSETQRLDAIALPALRSAAQQGGEQGTKLFDQFVKEIGPNRLVPEVTRARAELAARNAQIEDQRQTAMLDGIAGMENAGASAQAIRDTIEKTPNLTEQQRRAGLIRVDQIVGAAEEKTRELQRFNSFNDLSKRVYRREWNAGVDGVPNPAETVAEIYRRADLPSDNPNFIAAPQMKTLVDDVLKSMNFDARSAQIGAAFRQIDSGSGSVPVADPGKDGAAMLKAMADRGIVKGDPTGSDGFALRGIADPIAFARYTSRLNAIPNDAQEMIRTGITSSDPIQATDGLATYAALALQNPGLAGNISLPPEAELRARYVVSRLERAAPADIASPEGLRAAIAPLVNSAMQMDPKLLTLTKDQVLGQVYFKDAAYSTTSFNKATFVSDAQSKAAESIKGIAQEMGIGGKLSTIPGQVANDFNEILQEEYRFHRSLIPDDAKAAEAAQRAAMERMMIQHPPMEWGGVVRFGDRGEIAADPAKLREDATAALGKQAADALWSQYVPVYVQNGGKPGWIFRSLTPPYEPFHASGTGDPVVLNPYTAPPETNVQKVQRMIAERNKPTPPRTFIRAHTGAQLE